MGIKRYTIGAFETNTYLITKGDKAVVVDPGLDFISILDEVNKYKIVAVLITHAHVDHIDGCGMIDAPIYVGKDDLNSFYDLTNSLYFMTGIKPSYKDKKLNLIGVSDNEIINIDDFSFKVIHTPGHTMGSCCYLYYDNLFSGDTLFSGSIGRVDFPGGSMKRMKESLKKLKTLCNDNIVVYPGHDEKTTIKIEKKSNMYLINL
jgi:glyoxylase-like metal-dependent hydrolase (beta-lactamase superfamily II)